MTNTPRRFDENPNTTTNLQKDSTEYFGISQSGASKVIKTSDAFTKANVGLSEVDNTSDANKPISVAQQAALDLKADELDVTIALDLKADKSDTYTKSEVNTLNDAQDVNITVVADRQNVLLDNKVINGDFADGTDSWIPKIIGNTALVLDSSIYNTGFQSLRYDVISGSFRVEEQLINMIVNHVYFIFGKQRYNVLGLNSFGIRIYGTTTTTFLTNLLLTDTWNTTSGNYISDGTETSIAIIINAGTSVGSAWTDSVQLLDLTDIFADGIVGTGKEPNAKLMQKFIEQTGYFNDFHTMTNKEIVLAYSEYLKDIDTAITELGGTI